VGFNSEIQGYNFYPMLHFCRKFSSGVTTSINMNIIMQGVAKTSWDRVFKDVGVPQKVISDQGPQFVSRFIKELCSQLGVERNPSTAYHPQTDGQTERVNQELEQYLRLYCNYRQNDWAE